MSMASVPSQDIEVPPPPPEDEDNDDLGSIGVAITPMKTMNGGMSPRSPEHQEAIDRMDAMERAMAGKLAELNEKVSKHETMQKEAMKTGMVPGSVVALVIWQVAMLVGFGLGVDYSADLFDETASTATMLKYGHFQDIHVMIFVGFGFLMTFLRKYGLSAVSLNMLVSVFAIQWHILAGSFIHMVFEGTVHNVTLDLDSFILGDFAAAVVLITFGALIGKVTFQQLLVICFFEILFFSANEAINAQYFKTSDMGGSVVLHTFGAYFGLGCSWVMSPRERTKDHKDNASSYNSDIFAMIGTVFLFMFWPSFNSALAPAVEQQRTVVNTLTSITGSAASAFVASYFMRGGKFSMVDVQNATLAGGVAIGTASNMAVSPGGALATGLIAGILSVVGYTKITPYLEESIGLYDTCGVHNLHGMPGVLAGIVGAITAASATPGNYAGNAADSVGETNIISAFGGRYDGTTEERSAASQGGWQAAFLGFTLLTSILSGIMTGYIAMMIAGPTELFTDATDIDEIEDGPDDVPEWADNYVRKDQ